MGGETDLAGAVGRRVEVVMAVATMEEVVVMGAGEATVCSTSLKVHSFHEPTHIVRNLLRSSSRTHNPIQWPRNHNSNHQCTHWRML